ncbi:MAG: hypothetical protein K8R88_13025 [Armatimonadetes bacterium]|nr:hypothetical protein [Armatimonadota bacterium]
MKNRFIGALATFVATLVLVSSASAQISNGGFELGTSPDADNWTVLSNNAVRETNPGAARTGSAAMHMYGQFGAGQTDAVMSQDFAITPGKSATLTGYGQHLSSDAIGGTNLALIQVAYVDAANNIISASDSALITAATAQDSYQLLTASLGAAPANVAHGRVYLLFIQFGTAPGSVYFDDLSVVVADPPPPGLLANKSFELGSGTSPASWTKFANAYRESVGVPARTGTASLKMFGNFNGSDNYSGAYQYFACAPGQTVSISGYGQNWVNDAMQSGNRCIIKLVFQDAANNELASQESAQEITSASPLNTWVPMTASMVAPAGTDHAAFYVMFIQPAGNFNGGAAWVDDCDATVSGGGTSVSGTVNLLDFSADAGQVVTFGLYSGATLVETKTATLGTGGTFSFNTTQTGTYTIKAWARHWIKKSVTNVNTSVNVTGLSFNLPNADVNGDNVIDLSDYTYIVVNFNKTSSSSDWNTPDGFGISPADSDLNGDGVVDLTDYTILVVNFNMIGD